MRMKDLKRRRKLPKSKAPRHVACRTRYRISTHDAAPRINTNFSHMHTSNTPPICGEFSQTHTKYMSHMCICVWSPIKTPHRARFCAFGFIYWSARGICARRTRDTVFCGDYSSCRDARFAGVVIVTQDTRGGTRAFNNIGRQYQQRCGARVY